MDEFRRHRDHPTVILVVRMDHHHDVGAYYLLFDGSMDVAGEGAYATEDSRWVPAGHVTDKVTAGADGVDLIIIGIDGQADFNWD